MTLGILLTSAPPWSPGGGFEINNKPHGCIFVLSIMDSNPDHPPPHLGGRHFQLAHKKHSAPISAQMVTGKKGEKPICVSELE